MLLESPAVPDALRALLSGPHEHTLRHTLSTLEAWLQAKDTFSIDDVRNLRVLPVWSSKAAPAGAALPTANATGWPLSQDWLRRRVAFQPRQPNCSGRTCSSVGCQVQLVRQLSSANCTPDVSFGCYVRQTPEDAAMWVSWGCRGRFEVDGADLRCGAHGGVPTEARVGCVLDRGKTKPLHGYTRRDQTAPGEPMSGLTAFIVAGKCCPSPPRLVCSRGCKWTSVTASRADCAAATSRRMQSYARLALVASAAHPNSTVLLMLVGGPASCGEAPCSHFSGLGVERCVHQSLDQGVCSARLGPFTYRCLPLPTVTYRYLPLQVRAPEPRPGRVPGEARALSPALRGPADVRNRPNLSRRPLVLHDVALVGRAAQVRGAM